MPRLAIVRGEPSELSQAEWDQAFPEFFWPAYPRKIGRYEAQKSWSRLRPRTQETFDWILAGLEFHKNLWREEQRAPNMVPHASTFLNQHRWEDVEK